MTAADAAPFPVPELTPAPRVAVVAAPFYRAIADLQIAGARAALERAGAAVELIEVPGALELAPAIRAAALAKRFDGFVALGCVIRGETTHYDTVCEESARGLTLLGLGQGLAIGNGVLTVETEAQALERARSSEDGGQDKGGGAAIACLALIAVQRRFAAAGPSGRRGFRPDDEHILLA